MTDDGLTWNLVNDVRQIFAYHFMVNALAAGTIVAVVDGAIGYFMVLRKQSFVGHTLAVVGFPGAAGATYLGISAVAGYFGFCIAGALIIAALPAAGRARGGVGGYSEESAVIGTLQAFALACGFLFVSLYKGFLSALNTLLFGTITGVADSQVTVLLIAGLVALVLLIALGRPLLFTSVDTDVARARGVPVRWVSTGFLLLLGIAAAGTSQVTGSLLVFALLVAPAATAARLTARPALGVSLSIGIALVVTWLGEGIAFSPLIRSVSGSPPWHSVRSCWPPRIGVWPTGSAPSDVAAIAGWQGIWRAAGMTGIGGMLSHPFMQNAFLAGTSIALLSGLVGFFVVLRGQVFAGDALSHVPYAGALAALAAGVDLRFGLFAATVAVGLALGFLGGRAAADDAVIGTTFAWILGLGVFFLAYYTTHGSGSSTNGNANVTVLFGSIFGISAAAAATCTWIAAGLILVLVLIARPLLFASLDPAVAAGRGVPVRILGPLFLAIVGATAGEASQAVGALLLLGLLAAPAAAARRLTDRPWPAFALAGALAVAAMWAGLTLSYFVAALPPSFTIMTVAAAEYVIAAGVSLIQRRAAAPGPPSLQSGARARHL